MFTREKYGDPGLTGMDMIRLALERCRDSESALDLMIELLERYGQGGNCGYKKSFSYHNSFLIADKQSAWVLETAGKYWAAEKVSALINGSALADNQRGKTAQLLVAWHGFYTHRPQSQLKQLENLSPAVHLYSGRNFCSIIPPAGAAGIKIFFLKQLL